MATAETFTVAPPSAPTLAVQTANLSEKAGAIFTDALASGTFVDPQGATLTYAATQSSGAALPSWLSFNATTDTFSGTAPGTASSATVKVTATDTYGLSVSDSFTITTTAAVAPTLAVQTANLSEIVGAKFTDALVSGTFVDPQGAALTYTATQSGGTALPSWLSFNASTDTFAGTAPATAGTTTVTVKATDSYGLSVSDTFSIVTAAAKAPTLAVQTAGVSLVEGTKLTDTLAAGTFVDPQGAALTYSATQSSGAALPSWLSFNATTDTFSGTAPVAVGTTTVKVTATDTYGLSVSDTFTIATIAASAPILAVQTAGVTAIEGQRLSDTLAAGTFVDPQGAALTYTATQSNGTALPSWLSFNAATDTFSGTAPLTAGTTTVTVKATDTYGLAVTDSFAIVTAAAKSPTLTSQTAAQIWTQGSAVNVTLAAGTFTDPQSETLTYTATQSSGTALPAWLTFNGTTDTFTGTVPAGMASLTLKVTATDTSGLSATETFGVTVPAAAPTLTAQTATQSWTVGQRVSFALAANTFTDPQSEALTYSATQSNGSALPSWLSFNATTDTFSGTVAAGATAFSLTVTAKDTAGLSASETFGVTIPSAAPIVTSQTATQTWTDGTKVSLTLPSNTFTDPQGQALTYSAYQVLTPGSPLATSWLSFNSTTDTLSGTVPGSASGTLTLEVVAQNKSGLTATDLFNVTLKAATGGVVSGAPVSLVPQGSSGLGQLAAGG